MPRPYSMDKRGEAVRRTQLAVEAALIRLLALKPYASITIAEIAGEADVATRTVQRHYRTKERLLAACLLSAAHIVAEELSRQSPAPSPAEAIRVMVDTVSGLHEQYAVEISAAYARASEVPELAETLRVGTEAHASAVSQLIQRWPDAWAVDSEMAHRTIVTMTSYLTWRAFTDLAGVHRPGGTLHRPGVRGCGRPPLPLSPPRRCRPAAITHGPSPATQVLDLDAVLTSVATAGSARRQFLRRPRPSCWRHPLPVSPEPATCYDD